MVLGAVVVAISSLWWASSAQSCPVQTTHGHSNYGVNLGGCFMCHNEHNQLPSVAELFDLCKQTCLADPSCRAFETLPTSLARFYNVSYGVGINCCIEHTAMTNFENPVTVDESRSDQCQKEAACASTHDLAEECSRPSPPLPVPSTCLRDPYDLYVHDTPEKIQGLRAFMQAGCPFATVESRTAWDNVQCPVTQSQCVENVTVEETDSGGDSCSYYEDKPHYCGCCDTPLFSAARDCCACRRSPPHALAGASAGWWTAVFYSWPRKAVKIFLAGKGIQGELPENFESRWPNLVEISLEHNNFQGTLPSNIGMLRNLKSLNLGHNQLTGSVPPEFGNLSQLRTLVLSDNRLSGMIPGELGNLSQLRLLALGNNELTAANMSPELGNLSNLHTLLLNGNHLGSTIPAWLGSLSNLRVLDLQRTELTAGARLHLHELEKLTALNSLTLSGNRLGSIPTELAKLTTLRELRLNGNQLTGTIPPEFGNLSQLRTLVLNDNQLTGTIPAEVGNLSQLRTLALSDNRLSGTIPAELGKLSDLQLLHLQSNQLSGTIPRQLGNLSSLQELNLQSNQLSGTIPAELGNLLNLRLLDLRGNQVSGSLPPALAQLSQLQSLMLGNNQLSGNVPVVEVRRLWNLRYLVLSNNQFSGVIPAELSTSLLLLRLENNRFSGSIPAELGNLGNLRELHLHGNQLNGSLPPALGRLSQLQILNVADNQLLGGLPSNFGRMHNLVAFTADRNPHFCGDSNAISWLHGLRELRLRGCCFQTISRPPASLEYLDLGENKLTVLPGSLQELKAVKTLLLDHNSIAMWDTSTVFPLRVFGGGGLPPCDYEPNPRLQWLNVEVLDVSANLFGPPVFDFLSSLSDLPQLKVLRAADNHLSGALPSMPVVGDQFVVGLTKTAYACVLMEYHVVFRALRSLDLARNNITGILSPPPRHLQQVDLSGNLLTAAGLSDPWWSGNTAWGNNALLHVNVEGNPALRLPIRVSACPLAGMQPNLSANVQDWKRAGPFSECTTLCPRQPQLFFDVSAREEVLCRCSGGQGAGLNCTACPTDTYSVQSFHKDTESYVRTCRDCPVHSELRGLPGQCFADCSCRAGYYMQRLVNGSTTELGSASCTLLLTEAQDLEGQCQSCGIWRTSKAGSRSLASCLCNGNRSDGGWSGLLQEGTACRCPDGERIDFAERRCVQCDLAEDCTDWSKLLKPPKVKEGFWALPPPLEGEDGLYGNFAGHSIWRCDSPEACPGQSGACGWNRIGTACSLCKRGFFRTPSGSCSRCPQTYTQTRLMLLAALAACMIFPLLAHGVLSADSDSRGLVMTLRSFRISLKQVVKFAQILGVVSLFQVQWPAIVLSLFEVFRLLSFDLASWAGVACLAADQQQTVAFELSFRWMLPALGAAVTALSAVLATSCGLLCLRRRTGTRLGRLLTFRFWDVLRVLLFFLQLFYPSILNNAVLPLTCSPSPNGHFTMNFFPHVICWDLKHDVSFWPLALVGCVLTGLLIVGYPFLIFRLWRFAKVGSLARAAEDRWWSFLFEDFRFDGMGYTLVVLGKDVLLNLITVLLPGLGTAQLLLTAVASIGYAWLVRNAMPYKDTSNTLLEVCTSGAVAALCIFSAGMGFQSEPEVLDISSYLKEGRNNPVYLQRALTLICLQGLSLLAPAVLISYQLLSAFERTRRCVPRALLPVTDEQREAWRQDFNAAPFFVDQFDNVALASLHRIVMSSSAAKHSLRQASSREQLEASTEGWADKDVEQRQSQAEPQEEAPGAAEKTVFDI